MLITPRSLARSVAAGSTCVIRAASTATYTPNPAPSTAAATSAPGQVGQTASSTAATAFTTPDQITNTLRRPVRSERRPATTVVATRAAVYTRISTSSPSAGCG